MKIQQENGKFYKIVETKEEIDIEAVLTELEELKAKKENTGEENSGNRNSGNRNSGNWNGGNRNSGNCNSGDCNSGNRNSGEWNSGNWNSGDCNSGDCNSGNRNGGDWNSGNWNSGNRSSGYCNTQEARVTMFDVPTDLEFGTITFPDFFYFDTNVWVYADYMTAEEKTEHPEYATTGGYLKVVGLHDAWRISWNKAKDDDRRKCLSLPNWNNEKFKIISGIDVHAELGIS